MFPSRPLTPLHTPFHAPSRPLTPPFTPPHVPSPPLLVYGFVLKFDVPLSIFENPSDSDSDGDMVDLDIFVQKLDAETSGALT